MVVDGVDGCPWCSGWARDVYGPLGWMDPWCSGWACGVVDGPVVKWMCVVEWMGPSCSRWTRSVVDVPVV